ncbi:reverse gyrase [Thermocladium modestius]|uniref:reverse gyrase n=1 Tax=Thermocladium modestius TaxID=62609 RepID=UPI001E574C5D|nr:reverse gyrase [Thermocladium modestius]
MIDGEFPPALYRWACPNCGGLIDSRRLGAGLPCRSCLPNELENGDLLGTLRELEKLGTLKRMKPILYMYTKYNELNELFKESTGFEMWGAQRVWARRLVRGKSFAVIAPTGSGKTTFGIIASMYAAKRGSKSMIVTPTSTLAYQLYQRALTYSKGNFRIITYNSLLTKKERDEAMSKIKSGEYDILIVTNSFLSKHMDELEKTKYGLIFVDDVDSVLKASSKNIDRLLVLLGIPKEAIELGLEAIKVSKDALQAFRNGAEADSAELNDRVRDMTRRIREIIGERSIGTLVVSGVLTRPRGTLRALLFREFLGFEVGGRAEGLRNVVDLFMHPKDDVMDEVVKIVKKLGGGGIIFIPTDVDKEQAKLIAQRLEGEGIKAGIYLKPKKKLLLAFQDGEVDVLIGLATSRSSLVRGIDMPARIRYVVFAGVPKIMFKLHLEEFMPIRFLLFFSAIRPIAPDELKQRIDKAIGKLRKMSYLNQSQLREILEKAQANSAELSGFQKYVAETAMESLKLADELLRNQEVINNIGRSEISIQMRNGDFHVVLPDSTTYIQASGRTSRMYIGGVTHGLSIVIIDNNAVFSALQRDLRYRLDEVEFKDLETYDVDATIKVIDEERAEIAKLLNSEAPQVGRGTSFKSVLLVVESPTKARTIANFFGRPSRRITNNLNVYEANLGNMLLSIVATKGHMVELAPSAANEEEARNAKDYYGVLIRDGDFIPIYSTIKRCPACGRTYTDERDSCPYDGTQLITTLPVIDALRDLAVEADEVLIGTDPDSEGEKIAWDVYNMLRPYVSNIRRIEFHEVTKKAIIDAITNPRTVNSNMVKSQLVRRIEDRWIGFGLSKYLQTKLDRKNLSAGRVQTPVLGWIIRRHIDNKYSKAMRLTVALANNEQETFIVPLNSDPDAARQESKKLRNYRKSHDGLKVSYKKLEEVKETINPPPPYTTDAMLTDAANILRLDVNTTMRLAQDLFESGLITYHRTDSTRVSAVGLSIAKEYISNKFGEEEYVGRTWVTSEEGAHECIRPTRPIDDEELRTLMSTGVINVQLTNRHIQLYRLIFRRFMASQMRPAVVEKAKYKVSLHNEEGELASRETERVVNIADPGFQLILQSIRKRETLPETDVDVVSVETKTVRTVYPYREGDIIAEMKRKHIGRPSTYAKIIDTLLKRGYVTAIGSTKYLVPKRLGILAYICLTGDDYVREKLPPRREEDKKELDETRIKCANKELGKLVSEDRTKQLEEEMDSVEMGKMNYKDILNQLLNEMKELELFSFS